MPLRRARPARACSRRSAVAGRIAAGDVTLGPPTAAFARMVQGSHVLTSRGREIAGLTEQALGDAIAAETDADDPQQRIVAAQLASVHRVLFAEAPGAAWPASRATRSWSGARGGRSPGLRPARAVPGRLRRQGLSRPVRELNPGGAPNARRRAVHALNQHRARAPNTSSTIVGQGLADWVIHGVVL